MVKLSTTDPCRALVWVVVVVWWILLPVQSRRRSSQWGVVVVEGTTTVPSAETTKTSTTTTTATTTSQIRCGAGCCGACPGTITVPTTATATTTMEDRHTLIRPSNNNDDDTTIPSSLCSWCGWDGICGRTRWNQTTLPHHNPILTGHAFDLILVRKVIHRTEHAPLAAADDDADDDDDADSSVANWAGSEVLVEFGGNSLPQQLLQLLPSHLAGLCSGIVSSRSSSSVGSVSASASSSHDEIDDDDDDIDSGTRPHGSRIVLEIDCARRGETNNGNPSSASSSPLSCTTTTTTTTTLRFPICQRTIQLPPSAPGVVTAERIQDRPPGRCSSLPTTADAPPQQRQQQHHHQHCPHALAWLGSHLVAGRNEARYLLLDAQTGVVLARAPVAIFVWSAQDRVVGTSE